jgi:hypothetical protein
MNKIKTIYVEHIGLIKEEVNYPIEEFTVNGEMALVKWYRIGNQEYNGKYVIAIEYHE